MLSSLHISFLQHFYDFNDLSNKRPARGAWRMQDPQVSGVSTFKDCGRPPILAERVSYVPQSHLRRQPACIAFPFKYIF